MSELTYSILDAERAIHAHRHASFVDALVPALSDDPETITELKHALRRFLRPDEDHDPLAAWFPGVEREPHDAGICIIDLAARLIIFQSSYSSLLRAGQVTSGGDDNDPSQWIPYHIANDWVVTDHLDGGKDEAQERRKRRRAAPLDTRSVLYGALPAFLVDECFVARGGSIDSNGIWTPPADWQWIELPERAASGKSIVVADAVAEIHARWLMRPRDDLGGKSPRDVLHSQRSEIEIQIQDRETQWARSRVRPAPLWRRSHAYRFGGYGTHEMIVYYELVRHLLFECWDLVVGSPQAMELARDAAIERLGAAQQQWLNSPNNEDFGGKTPRRVIEVERSRLPMGSSGDEAMIDCNCPLCQMMAENGPVFWHLDDSNMDSDFPFSVFETSRADWESSYLDWDDNDAKSEDTALEETGSPAQPFEPGDESSPVWQRSLVISRPSDSPSLVLFGLGCHLAELVEDLRGTADSQRWIDTLNRDFGNLRSAVAQPASSLVEPVIVQFGEHLHAVSETEPALSAKCLDLDRQLMHFADRLNGGIERDSDTPF